jgi:energy-coupling factor transport system ATP-binding protein
VSSYDPFEIDLEGVTFTYEDGAQALIDLSLKACSGEFVVVLGANGAGKSTLCFLLSGIVPHIFGGKRTGKVSVAGHDPWDDPIFVTSQYCGVLLQDPEVQLFNPTVFTEMAFGPSNLKVPRQEIIQRIEQTLALLHLDGQEKRNPRDLSGGQKQRVALGSVLSMRPRVLVLDEPTSQLDPVGRWEVVEAIHQLKSTGKMTIVMTTHETDDILDLADQVLVLDGGRVVLSGKPTAVFGQPEALKAAGVKIPDALNILNEINLIAERSIELTDEQVTRIDAQYVGGEVSQLIQQKRLEIVRQETQPAPPQAKDEHYALEAIDLTYKYPGFPPVTALQDINVTIRPGELVGIVGQNGSGKSTLAKCFVGLLRPSSGEVRVNGENIRKVPVGEMARQVGLVLQNPDYQLFTISSREEIYFGLKNIGIEGEDAEVIVTEVLSWVGLQDQIETFPFRMSFGDRRKLAVAATVALDPQVLILDEPTTAQDHRGRYQLAEIGRRFRDEKGRTILMITHDMDLIAQYAERLIVMWNGKILQDGPTSEVFSRKEDLVKTFLRPPAAAEVALALQPLGFPADVITPEGLIHALHRRAA